MTNIKEKIVAHRGESMEAPENSLSAINLAWERGSRAVEVDVHLTYDNQIVIIHDAHTGRVGDKKLVIRKSTLNEISSVDVGIKKGIEFKGEKIPTLKEVIQTIPEDGKLIIEVKCDNQIVPFLCSMLKSLTLPSWQIEVISFNYNILVELKKELPQFRMLWLLNLDYYFPWWMLLCSTKKTVRKVVSGNLDGVNVWAGKKINKHYVNQYKQHNLLVYTWTINELNMAQKVLSDGVDAITTDRASWLCTHLSDIKE